jgi:gas vesicle protein
MSMARERHRGAFVIGSILGGAVGALAALWNTPQSGEELRRKLGFESEVAHGVTSAARGAANSATAAAHATGSLSSKALSVVEHAAAPLVGVKLGQTANNSQPAPATVPASTAPATNPVEPVPATSDTVTIPEPDLTTLDSTRPA